MELNVGSFADGFEDIFIRIEGTGHAFPGQIQVVMLLASFSEKSKSPYGHIVAPLQSVGHDMAWERVSARLSHEYK